MNHEKSSPQSSLMSYDIKPHLFFCFPCELCSALLFKVTSRLKKYVSGKVASFQHWAADIRWLSESFKDNSWEFQIQTMLVSRRWEQCLFAVKLEFSSGAGVCASQAFDSVTIKGRMNEWNASSCKYASCFLSDYVEALRLPATQTRFCTINHHHLPECHVWRWSLLFVIVGQILFWSINLNN